MRLQLVGSAEIEAVDLRLGTLCRALSSSLELEHWKFDSSIKEAISGGDDSFARLCAATQPLAELVLSHAAVTCVTSCNILKHGCMSVVVLRISCAAAAWEQHCVCVPYIIY